MKPILLLVLVALGCCNKFIETPNGAKITLEICGEEGAKIIRTKIDPEEIVPGGTISLKEQFQVLKDVSVKDLHIEVFNEGIQLQIIDQPIKKSYKAGDKDVANFKTQIPGFCPPGKWDIYAYIRSDSDEKLCCLKAHFEI